MASFQVRPVENRPITRLTGMWPEETQRALVSELLEEPCTLEGAELLEMLELALQDLTPVDCGIKLLEVLLGDAMTRGMRDHVSRDMMEQESWVHHSHLEWHRAIYEASWLAHAAHGGAFVRPHANAVFFDVEALDEEAVALIDQPVTPALAARLVAAAVPTSILARLFEDELASRHFPEAPSVVWRCVWSKREASARLEIEGSAHWFGGIVPGEAVEAEAWVDVQSDPESPT